MPLRLAKMSLDVAVLEAALERARGGSGQVVGVVAEAGTGKSRLCAEFLDRVKRTVKPHGAASTPRCGRSHLDWVVLRRRGKLPPGHVA